jgi:CheY-like chemotaxis protein
MAVRCLIVDDNRDFLRVASDLLGRAGITVVGVATTGAQARVACGELHPDVALVDIDLGEESGFEIAHQLAGVLGCGQPRVILVSVYSAEDFGDMITATPAVSFLPKSALSGQAIRGIIGPEPGAAGPA